ncbi:MAG TPA: outer membrane lipoprotein chaperone LolA [Gemmatimonadota bacterium]|nr:outer membrane lipoprotein chaperone LolA [Gemmatimonadota bacterium]
MNPLKLSLRAGLTAFLLAGTGADARSAQGAPGDTDAIVRRADRALEALRTLRTEFTQRVENPVLEKSTIGRGRLAYRAPDRFRIAYSDPAGDLVVNDGAHVWIYLPSSQPGQVIRRPAAESGVRNPITYLRDLRSGHIVRHVGVEKIGRAADHLVLTPDLSSGGSGAFTRLDVWVDQASGLLRQVRTESADGVVTTYTFQGLEPGVALDGSLFRFAVPRGVEVFDA